MKAEKILKNFPKKRINLPQAYKDIYVQHYIDNRAGKSFFSKYSKLMETWLHRKVAEDLKNRNENISTLEIGAGNLNQLAYEPNIIDYDIVEPFDELLEDASDNNIRHRYRDISEIEGEQKYQRITSIATFEHICNFPEVLSHTIRLIKKDGCLRISIPNEGTIMWKLGTMVTGFEFERKHKLKYKTIMKHEHVNTAKEIELLLKFFYKKVKAEYMGINKHLAFYCFFECTEPNYEKNNLYKKKFQSPEQKHQQIHHTVN